MLRRERSAEIHSPQKQCYSLGLPSYAAQETHLDARGPAGAHRRGLRRAVLHRGSPRDAYGMVRYALPHMKLGNLKVGDQAPDFEAVALDGETRVRLYDRVGQRPLVLVFGSYT